MIRCKMFFLLIITFRYYLFYSYKNLINNGLIEVEPPEQMGVNFEGKYDSIPCTESNKKTITDTLAIKLANLDCNKAGMCEISIQEPVCSSSRKKVSTGSSLTVSIGLHSSVNSKGSTFNVAGLLQNNTGS